MESRFEPESYTFFLKVEETPELWPEESARARTPVTCHDHVEPMQWRHLNVFNKECVIVCALPRGSRSNDGKVYRVTKPWEGRRKHSTQEFEAFALTLMREMPVKRAGQILGESNTRMSRMLFAHVKAPYERLSFENVVWLGADEMNRRKGHNYLTVFADLLAKRVIFATPGKPPLPIGNSEEPNNACAFVCSIHNVVQCVSRKPNAALRVLQLLCKRSKDVDN